MSIKLKSTKDIAREISQKAKERRLSLNLSQKTLAEKSGVSYGSLKKFEQQGQISLCSLLKIALTLDCLGDFSKLFEKIDNELPLSLDDILNEKTRKRGRN